MTELTPSQTAGPFLHIGLIWPGAEYAVPEGTPNAFWLRGTVYDGKGDPVGDCLVETWQTEPEAFARTPSELDGTYAIHTVAPAPGYLDLSIHARGLLDRLVTRVYFTPDEFYTTLDPARRETLIALPTEDGFRFDIHLQGDQETMFFDV
jgi:protocatechuate 3,4-dioxygenase, alpha subunit